MFGSRYFRSSVWLLKHHVVPVPPSCGGSCTGCLYPSAMGGAPIGAGGHDPPLLEPKGTGGHNLGIIHTSRTYCSYHAFTLMSTPCRHYHGVCAVVRITPSPFCDWRPLNNEKMSRDYLLTRVSFLYKLTVRKPA